MRLNKTLKTLTALVVSIVIASTMYSPMVFAGETDTAASEPQIMTLDEMSDAEAGSEEEPGQINTEPGDADSDITDPAPEEVDPSTLIKPDKKHCKVTIVAPEGAPEGFKVTVRKKFDGSGAKISAKVGTTYLLTKGIYCMWINQPGYYKVKQPFYVKAGDLKKEKLIAAGTDLMTGNGPEPDEYFFRWNPQVEDKFYGTSDLPGLMSFDTPAFREDKGPHEFTSAEERVAYLEDIVSGSDRLHMFYLDDYVPVIFCTDLDLSAAANAEEAAAIVSADSKLKICYQAQVHGNEPASGEAAMYIVKELAGDFGEYVAANADLYIIPCINPEGSDAFSRYSTLDDGASYNIDLNRDALRLKSDRIRQVHWMFNIIMPEVTVDTHESRAEEKVTNAGVIKHLEDIKIRGVDNPNTNGKIRTWCETITKKSLQTNQSAGLRPFYYLSTVNSTASRGYYGMYDTVSLIVESVGLREGKDHFQRRVYSQCVSIHSIIELSITNSDKIKKDVSVARNLNIEKGKTFSKSNNLF